jgi:hypothetical protein
MRGGNARAAVLAERDLIHAMKRVIGLTQARSTPQLEHPKIGQTSSRMV